MFRLLRLKPPHGWNAVVWELAIVTLGVIVALAAQQWADERSWRGKVDTSRAALRDELSEHYGFAVEFRTVYPCMQAQLARLRERMLRSGAVLDPAPIYHEPGYDFVLRIPTKEYGKEAWEAAINDGTAQRLDNALRRALAAHYAQLGSIRDINSANDKSEQEMVALAHPLPLDPMVRYSALKEIELLGGRLELLDILNEQAIDSIHQSRLLPPRKEALNQIEDSGTYQFCKAHALPLRPFNQATQIASA
jgi:hypothetical protein